jgi:hypothetical protein
MATKILIVRPMPPMPGDLGQHWTAERNLAAHGSDSMSNASYVKPPRRRRRGATSPQWLRIAFADAHP